MTLLEKAVVAPNRRSGNMEKMQIAVAWVLGEINATQVMAVLGIRRNSVSTAMASLLCQAVRAGLLVRPSK